MRALAIALSVALALGACGGDEEADPEADRQRAEAAVLTVEDLPAGFEEGEAEQEEDESDAADRCLEGSGSDVTPEEVDEARTARVAREFETGEGLNVEAEVVVYEDDDVPSALVDVLQEEEALECLTDAIQEEAAAGNEELSIAAADVGSPPAVPDDLGDQRAAARLDLTIEHSSGQSFDFVADLYAVRVDRAVATLTVSQVAGQELAEGDAHAALDAMATRLENGD